MPPSRENRRRNRRSSMDNPFGNVFPPPPNLPDLSNPPPDFYPRPIPPPLTESYPSIPRLGSCRGCFRSSETETEPLSEIKLLDYPWGGFLGPGELFIIKLLFELGIPFKESSFYLPEEKRKPNTYELVNRFLKQVRESKGYVVDFIPPGGLSSPFLPVPANGDGVFPNYYEYRVVKPTEHQFRHIRVNCGDVIENV